MSDFIPVNEPDLQGREDALLQECITTGWISSEGPFVSRFEQRFAERVGRRFGVAVSSGTAALDVSVASLDLGPGDEVIMPAFTIISCASAIVRAGATPVLVDSDPLTWNMDPVEVERRISPRTRAIMAVHIYGQPVDMVDLLALADAHGLKVIEDAAQMHGQTCHARPCGSFGELSTFSFYPNKHITTGEGGMVVTDDEALAERCRSLRNLCFQPGRRFVHEELGWNYRMSNIQAAIGLAQLERLDEFVVRKRNMGARYTRELSTIADLQLPLEQTPQARNIYWVFGVVAGESHSMDAAQVIKRLAEHKIGTRAFFWPMHEQPVFRKMGLFENERYPVAERLARRGFYLPSGLGLNAAQMDRVVAAMHEVFG